MSIILSQGSTALVPGNSTQFLATGGTSPYTYSVLPGGAGGTINASTGAYTAPAVMGSTPQTLYDTIRAVDSLSATATASILVGTPLFLFCEILQTEMGLATGRVYLWDQKVFQPSDNNIYIAVGEVSCKPFGTTTRPLPSDGSQIEQWVSMSALLDIDIMSRGPSARDRKEEILLALNSPYAQYQQDSNGFYIGKLPAGSRFINLSAIDGAAIPYRYKVSVNIQYAFKKTKSVPYFDTFQSVPIATNP